jgi:hypothetical protein
VTGNGYPEDHCPSMVLSFLRAVWIIVLPKSPYSVRSPIEMQIGLIRKLYFFNVAVSSSVHDAYQIPFPSLVQEVYGVQKFSMGTV